MKKKEPSKQNIPKDPAEVLLVNINMKYVELEQLLFL